MYPQKIRELLRRYCRITATSTRLKKEIATLCIKDLQERNIKLLKFGY
jgi:hypothetical protein